MCSEINFISSDNNNNDVEVKSPFTGLNEKLLQISIGDYGSTETRCKKHVLKTVKVKYVYMN